MDTVITCSEVKPGSTAQLKQDAKQKVVHLVRHGQATHNLFAALKHTEGTPCKCALEQSGCPYTNDEHTDAKLTQRGRLQAVAAGASLLQTSPAPEFAFVSPLSRTLQTATIALSKASALSIPLVAEESLRERNGVHVCDKRSPKEDVMDLYPNVDFGSIVPGPDTLFTDIRETVDELAGRGKKFFLSLKDRPETCFAVFTHSSFLFNTLSRGFHIPEPSGKFIPSLVKQCFPHSIM